MNDNYLYDIQDGCAYSHLMKPDNFLSYPEHMGLMLNTDGVAVFNSSRYSLWPIYLSVTNLPPHLRMHKDYILLAGLWYGPVKPNMEIILKPVLDEIDRLNYLGIEVPTSDGTKRIRAMLLLSVFDLPAKALAVNMKQFNGRFGCLYCTHPGESFRPGTLVYSPNTLCVNRTHAQVQQWASEAASSGNCVFGIKGKSPLAPYIDIVNCIPVDYMHAVLEGVTKQFLMLWFNTKNHKSSFYLGKKVKEIDSLLTSIKPPIEFRRSPRPIATSVKFWKACEFRAWLLFYSLPILQFYLPSEYVHHWSLLVLSIHALLSNNLPKLVLPLVSDSLQQFYSLTPQLYGIESCTANLHSIIHLTKFVELWGPLWTHSLFGFENMNGHIRQLFHGTRQVLDQLVFSIKAEQSLLFKTYKLNERETAYFPQGSKSSTGWRFEGKSKKVELANNIHKKIEECIGRKLHNHHHLISRFRCGSSLFQSEYFSKKSRLRDSCVCSFRHSDGGICYARILLFDAVHNIAVVNPYASSAILLGGLRVPRQLKMRQLSQQLLEFQKDNFLVVSPDESVLLAIPVCNIINSCVYIKCMNDCEIIISVPNNNEFH